MFRRLFIFAAIVALPCIVTFQWLQVSAASTDVNLRITAHCENGSENCPESIAINDSTDKLSQAFRQGDIITFDIRIDNPSGQSIASTQTWLSYNPQHLEGLSIDTFSNFDLVAPGEKTFDSENGRAKIGVASTQGGVSDNDILVATLKFKVIASQASSSIIEFYDHRINELGHTNVNIVEEGFPVNVLTETPKNLEITLNGGVSIDQGGPTPDTSYTPLQIPDLTPTITLGRPQNLMIDTGDSYTYLIWDLDQNDTLAGYNLYYSMESGRYIHKKSIGLVDEFYITGLVNEETYFFAITAVNVSGNESDYSDEVAITINHTETSTSPMAASQLEQPILTNATTSETGPATNMILILASLAGFFGFFFSASSQSYARKQAPFRKIPHTSHLIRL